MNTIVIGIAGGTGSGKTTLANKLKEAFGDDIVLLCHDYYYKAHDDMPFEERQKLNFDHPMAFDTDLLVEDLRALKRGESICTPSTPSPSTPVSRSVYRWTRPAWSLWKGSSFLKTRNFGTRWTSRYLWIPTLISV